MGTPASSMELQLFSTTDKFMQKLDDNEALLGSYPVDDDCKIHVCTSVLKHCSHGVSPVYLYSHWSHV